MDTVKMVFFLKPDAVIRRYVGARTFKTLLERVEGLEFLTFIKLTPEKDFLANQHYVEHKGKFFFNWLVNFTTVAPIYFTIIRTSSDKIEEIRKILGPTLVQKAVIEAPGTIRGRYGIYGGVNVAHASDSKNSAIRESGVWEEYLRRIFGDKIYDKSPIEVRKEIEGYIEQYIDYPIIDNIRYIELSKELESDPSRKEEIREKFINLLLKETSEDLIHDQNKPVEKLAEMLVRNALLRK